SPPTVSPLPLQQDDSPTWSWTRPKYIGIVVIGVTLISGAIIIGRLPRDRVISSRSSRFSITPPDGVEFRELSLSRNGRWIGLVGTTDDGDTHLWIRSIDDDQLNLIEAAISPSSPFWSPDNQTIAFFSNGSLHKLRIGDHTPQMV